MSYLVRRSACVLICLGMIGCGGGRSRTRAVPTTVDQCVAGPMDDTIALLKHRRPALRQVAAQALGWMALQHSRQDRKGEAERAARALCGQYRRERNEPVRLTILLALRDAGVASGEVYQFLKRRLLLEESSIEVMHVMASLGFAQAYHDILPFLQPREPEVAYEAALALSMLIDDERVPSALELLAERMTDKSWPPMLAGMPLKQCRENLRTRAAVLRTVQRSNQPELMP